MFHICQVILLMQTACQSSHQQRINLFFFKIVKHSQIKK
nr:MAG TPA: hypothetical protein [Caudoviricetes sp.]